MGKIVEWLGKYAPAELFAEKGWELAAMAAMMAFSVVWAFAASNVRLQTLQGVFPMRLRWNFHRLMLNQSLGFIRTNLPAACPPKSCRPRWRCATR